MSDTFEKLDGYDVYSRDRLQFEIKTDFLPDPNIKENKYTQEFYIFLPQALQVNRHSYTRNQFYRDETNLIRFKTPIFSLSEIADPDFKLSPMTRIREMQDIVQSQKAEISLINELKLLANVIRSSVRTRSQYLSSLMEGGRPEESFAAISRFCSELDVLLVAYNKLQRTLLEKWSSEELAGNISYVSDFINQVCEQFLLQLLMLARKKKLNKVDVKLTELVDKLSISSDLEAGGESVIYEKSLLNKYVLDALLLSINRFKPAQKYKSIIGSLAAGIAMFLYVILFVLFGQVWVINSEPFLLATVLIYILKDRLKESLKSVLSHERLGWFSDFRTEICSPDEKHALGVLKEKFEFLNQEDVPKEIHLIRNKEFHSTLESFTRPESVIYYKKDISIFEKPEGIEERRYMLNIIFRMSIRDFMAKASDPYSTFNVFDSETKKVVIKELPKVYHLNIIMKTSVYNKDGSKKIELKKFRIIADKNGIKRVEHL